MNPFVIASPQAVGPAPERMRVAQSLLAVIVYLVFAAVHEVEIALGLIDPAPARVLSAFTLSGAVLFYGLVRSGLSRRWFDDATLVEAQCLFGVLGATMAYAANNATRGAVMMIMLMILMFGMFELRQGAAWRIGAFSLAMLGAVMAWSSSADPSSRPASVELVHFLYATIGVLTVLVLSQRLGVMRQSMADQKRQLEQALDRVQELALRDELTGLVNRRHAMLRLDAELLRHTRHTASMSVAIIDLDFFKQVNDRHGHAAGDGVLRSFARLAGDALRATDVLARWGGEEFLLMMPMTPEAMAVAALERLRVSLSNHPATAFQPSLRVTFSAGVATLRRGESVEALIDRADRAMYEAKRNGRNRTAVAAG